MAAKDLSRTLIEPGRATFSKVDRHLANKRRRSRARSALRAVPSIDPEDFDLTEKREPIELSMGDRTGPMMRFLDSRVGYSWDRTYSILRERFDVRSIRGFHLFSHVDMAVDARRPPKRQYLDHYRIDAWGILRKAA